MTFTGFHTEVNPKQEREMNEVFQRRWFCDITFSLEKTEVNKTSKIGRFTGRKLFLIAANDKVLKKIHVQSHAVLEDVV